MKTILYMAESLNGYIAKENGDTSWIGKSDQKVFAEATKRAGNLVMGRNTYEAMVADDNFPLPGRLNVVMTREMKEADNDQVLFTNMSPGDVVNYLKDKNFEEIMIVGGGRLAKSFLEQKLIDEIFVSVEPVILGRGVPFVERGEFVEAGDLEVNLKLLEIIQLSESEIQLHYEVVKEEVLESDLGKEIEE